MHVLKGAWRILFCLALVTFALLAATPLTTPTATQAQTPATTIGPNSISRTGGACVSNTDPACYVSVNPALAFNVVGTSHTVAFTCGAAVGPAPAALDATGAPIPGVPTTNNTGATGALPTDLSGGTANAAAPPVGPGLVPGCYDVTASVTDESTGSATAFTYAQCGSSAATINGSSVNCASYASPLCPIGATTVSGTGAYCSLPDCVPGATAGSCASTGTPPVVESNAPRSSQMQVSINPGAPHSYLFTFTGYTLLLDSCAAVTNPAGSGTCTSTVPGATTSAACPAGFTYRPGPFSITENTFSPPFEAQVAAPDGVCQFTLTAEKKYIEITSLTLAPNGPCVTGTPTASALTYAEGLKAFFGPSCQLVATATGVVILKSGVNCASEPPANGTPASAAAGPAPAGGGFPAGSTYACTGDTLQVIIPGITTLGGLSIPVNITVVGGGAALSLPTPTLGTLCTGSNLGGTLATFTGTTFFVCPSGPGVGSVKACTTSTIDTQPIVCSNTLAFNFTVPNQSRVVPYVRWSGEKQVLTKCFGGAGLFGGSLVEFTLEGAGASADATLIPASLGPAGTAGGAAPITAPSQNTVITVTDADGCASVIVYATGEGVVNVDAAIYSTAPTAFGTVPLLNEHAFEIFYLKFDHVDLENIKMNTVTANPFTALGFSSAPTGFGTTTAGTFTTSTTISGSLPNAPGTNPPGANGYAVPLCQFDYMRAWVHGYFDWPGDPSGRPATTVGITGAPSGAATSYVLPAGRWVLPEDWPVLATFAGFTSGAPNDTLANSVFSLDLNSGWAFNPGGENPVICAGPQFTTNASGTLPSITGSGAITTANIAEGPCYGRDAGQQSVVNGGTAAGSAGTFYTTAPDTGNCTTGITVGIGPFDPTQSCTTPFPLTYTPAGGSVLASNGGGSFGVFPISTNSTYLPNGTLNEWDAPMPPAEVQFNITGGPGYLAQVNKTALYSLNLLGTCSGAGCTVPVVGQVYPDPFYAEAIPASPLIPPITNDGGYLWDTFGFRGGQILGPTTGPATIPGLASGAVPGPAGSNCGESLANGSGFTFIPGAISTTGDCFVGSAGVPDTLVTLAECNALTGAWTQVNAAGSLGLGSPATGTCEIAGAPATAPGGINLTNFGPGCPTFAGLTQIPQSPNPPGTYANQVEVANATGFAVGMTVTVYNAKTGAVEAQGLTITAVTSPGPDGGTTGVLTFNPATVPGGLCTAVFQGLFIADQIVVPVPASNGALATLATGTTVGVTTPYNGVAFGTPTATTTVFSVNPATGQIVLNGGSALAQALGSCILVSATGGAVTTCNPATFLPAGAIITGSPNVGVAPIFNAAELTGGQGPYPFWQWVPNASTGSTSANTATMYSDNHGEAIVSLQTGVSAQVAPVAGVCPTNYTLTPGGTNCLLNYKSLTGFQNITALGTAVGCIATTPAGGNSAVPAPTAATAGVTPSTVGGTGPASGQICINNLGGIEFGPQATLGLTTVQAIADYPYAREHPAVSSGVINKVWTSGFAKTLTVSSTPIAGPSGTSSYTVTIQGFDICGNAIVGEPVEVYALTGAAGAVVLAPTGTGGSSNGTGAATVYLNSSGTATLSLEVLNQALGTSGLVVKAVFPLEEVERFVTVIAGTTGPTTTTQIYPPGYNMVGGPAGTNFGAAEALFTYDATSGTYATASSTNISSAAPSCVGYWAYFASATSVNITVTSKPGDTATCQLSQGWNLVGDPFGSAAQLPSGVVAYHYNPTSQAYDQVSQIPVGGAVFIYEAGPNTVLLTAT